MVDTVSLLGQNPRSQHGAGKKHDIVIYIHQNLTFVHLVLLPLQVQRRQLPIVTAAAAAPRTDPTQAPTEEGGGERHGGGGVDTVEVLDAAAVASS